MYLPRFAKGIQFLEEIFKGQLIEIRLDASKLHFLLRRGDQATLVAEMNISSAETWLRLDAVDEKHGPVVQKAVKEGRFSNLEIDDE